MATSHTLPKLVRCVPGKRGFTTIPSKRNSKRACSRSMFVFRTTQNQMRIELLIHHLLRKSHLGNERDIVDRRRMKASDDELGLLRVDVVTLDRLKLHRLVHRVERASRELKF